MRSSKTDWTGAFMHRYREEYRSALQLGMCESAAWQRYCKAIEAEKFTSDNESGAAILQSCSKGSSLPEAVDLFFRDYFGESPLRQEKKAPQRAAKPTKAKAAKKEDTNERARILKFPGC